MNECVQCGKEAIHFPVVGFYGDTDPYCGYCYHGVSMDKAVDLEGCGECEEALLKV